MRQIDANTLAALKGSRQGDSLTVWAWYDGKLAYPKPLPVSAWSMDWDDTRAGLPLNLTVDDPSGQLAPWLLEDPLGVGGTRLQVIYNVGGAGAINLGWYRVTQTDPTEKWATYTITDKGVTTPNTPVPPGKRLATVPMGAVIQVTAEDYGVMVAASRFIAPESPQGTSPTIVGEIRRLMDGIAPVTALAGVTDRAVNTTLVYNQDRWAAVQDLAQRIQCAVRFNGNGQLEVYPLTSAPVTTLNGGPEGITVSVNRAQKYDGLYNIFVADGTATVNGQSVPVRGVATIASGPLRVNGPHGRVPTFYSSTMLTTQAECDAYALTMRDTQIRGLTSDVKFVCLPMPHLQAGDWATVYIPTADGRVVPLSGRLVAMGLRSAGSSVAPMTGTLRCAYADVKAAFASGSDLSIAGPVNRT